MRIESYFRPRNWEAIITTSIMAAAFLYCLVFQPIRAVIRIALS